LAAAVLSIGKLTVEQSRYYERQVAQGVASQLLGKRGGRSFRGV
jgi:hypothetical protein